MRRGTEVIYQATFFDGRWRGHADFLLRTERPSLLGDWSYDVADTKLARGVKAGAILQVCVYADRLAGLQGVPPERLVIVTGDNVERRLGETDAGDARAGGVEHPSRLRAEVGRQKLHHLRHWSTVRLIVNVSRVTVLLAIASAGPLPTRARSR